MGFAEGRLLGVAAAVGLVDGADDGGISRCGESIGVVVAGMWASTWQSLSRSVLRLHAREGLIPQCLLLQNCWIDLD